MDERTLRRGTVHGIPVSGLGDVSAGARIGSRGGVPLGGVTMTMEQVPDWQAELEALVRGISHAISNRLLSIGVLVELGPERPDDGIGLRQELDRLRDANRLLKLVVADLSPRPEAVELAVLLEEALTLHATRIDLRSVRATLAPVPELPPVHAPRAALLRLLVLLLADAGRAAARANQGAVTVEVSGDARAVRVACVPTGDELAPMLVRPGTRTLAERIGATLEPCGAGQMLVLPATVETP